LGAQKGAGGKEERVGMAKRARKTQTDSRLDSVEENIVAGEEKQTKDEPSKFIQEEIGKRETKEPNMGWSGGGQKLHKHQQKQEGGEKKKSLEGRRGSENQRKTQTKRQFAKSQRRKKQIKRGEQRGKLPLVEEKGTEGGLRNGRRGKRKENVRHARKGGKQRTWYAS